MLEPLRRFRSDDSGQGLVEYILMIALVAIGLILIIIVFRKSVGTVFKTVSDTLDCVHLQKGKSHNCF